MAEPYKKVVAGLRQMLAKGEKSQAAAEQYANANGWTMAELKAASAGDGLTDVTAPVLQGVSMGFGDEISAGLRSGFGMLGDYDEKLAQERALVKRAESQNPVGSTVAKIAGAIAPGVVGAPLAVAKYATSGLGKIAEAGARMAGLGAAEGAIYGAGKGENAEERKAGAVTGAAYGAALGPVAGAAGDVVGRVGRNIVKGVQNLARPTAAARGQVSQALARDGMSPDEFNRQFATKKAVRPDTMAMDAGGEAMRTRVELAAQSPGAARSLIKPGMERRQVNQLHRISNDLRALTGSSETAIEATERLIQERAKAAAPFYKAAEQRPVEGQSLAAFLGETSRGYGKEALDSPDYRKLLESEYGIKNPTVPPQDAVAVDLRLVDGWKKIIGDMEKAALRSGNDNRARVLGDVRRRVIDEVKADNPDYARALKEWSGPSQFIDAIDAGRSFQKMTAEEVQIFMKGAAKSEREGFRIGAVSSMINHMEGDRAKMADFTKFFRGEGMRKKIEAIMPTPEAAKKWADIFEAEQSMTELTAQALSNSATARRMMAKADADEGDVFDFLLEASEGVPGLMQMVRGWVGKAAGGVRDSMSERTNARVAEMLTANTPAEFNAMMKKGTPLGYNTGASRLRGGGVGSGASIAAPDANPELAFPY